MKLTILWQTRFDKLLYWLYLCSTMQTKLHVSGYIYEGFFFLNELSCSGWLTKLSEDLIKSGFYLGFFMY